jgi:2-oxo-3-hexenedioate decarboxylase
MLDPDKVEEISIELMSLRGTGQQIEPFTKRFSGFGLQNAYEVVARIRDLRIELGERPVGRKIGFTNRSLWQAKGISAPIWNYVFDRTVNDIDRSGADLHGMPEPRIEPEVVLHLCEAPQPRMSTRQLLECVDWIAPDFEVVYSVFPDWEFAAADAAAAFRVHGALFVGQRVEVVSAKPAFLGELSDFNVVLNSDDGLSREGTGRNVLGGPIHALKFLVDELARFSVCEPLRAGEVVTTGTLTEAMPLGAGRTWSARFDGIGFRPIQLTAS